MPELCGGFLLKIGYWFYVNTRFGRWYFNKSLEKIEATYPLGHSAPVTLDYSEFHVHIVSYSKDNYGFIIWRERSHKCLIIDPGYFPPFAVILSENHLILNAVLITHKHYDHCGSLDNIKVLFPNVKIFGHTRDNIRACTNKISEIIVEFDICEDESQGSIKVKAYHTPGHTVGHLIYTIEIEGDENSESSLLVFTGDAIFLGSIGAMFEETVKVNVNSLQHFLRELLKLNIPANRIYMFPGHEYAIESLEFLIYNCSPYSSLARKKLSWCEEQRTWFLPTIPVTLFEELSYSPYLRIAAATFLGEDKLCLVKITENVNEKYYLPHVHELIHELLLTEKFIRKTVLKNKYDTKSIKEILFKDIFSSDQKMLLRCEKCSPEPFTLNPKESSVPAKCIISPDSHK